MNTHTTSPNSGHTATLCFAKIGSLRSLTSHIPKPLAEIPHAALGIFKNKEEIILRR